MPVEYPGRYLLPLAVLAVAAIAIELAVVPIDVWRTRLVGSNSLICLAAALHECFLPDRVETEPLKKLTQYKRP